MLLCDALKRKLGILTSGHCMVAVNAANCTRGVWQHPNGYPDLDSVAGYSVVYVMKTCPIGNLCC